MYTMENDYKQYRKELEYKYCNGQKLEPTGNYRWVEYKCDTYTLTPPEGYVGNYDWFDPSTNIGYYLDEEHNYMLIPIWHIYWCDSDEVQYVTNEPEKVQVSNANYTENECLFDENTSCFTTNKQSIYSGFKKVSSVDFSCGKNYYINYYGDAILLKKNAQDYKHLLTETITTGSSSCGYSDGWEVVSSGCCGSLEFEDAPSISITSVEGDWIRNGNTFTNNQIAHSQTTTEKINFSFSGKGSVKLIIDQQSEYNHDYLTVAIDRTATRNTNDYSHRGKTTGSTLLNVTEGEHYLSLCYSKDSTQTNLPDTAVVTIEAVSNDFDCTRYATYNIERHWYRCSNEDDKVYTDEYRYGSIIQLNAGECGYIATQKQWVLVCPDILDIPYEDIEVPSDCVICENTYDNNTSIWSPSLYVAEKYQESYDGGVTWVDTTDPETGKDRRTQKLIRDHSAKCGYTGDRFKNEADKDEPKICEDGKLYEYRYQWVSSDDGEHWTKIEGTKEKVEIGEC